MSDEFRFHSTSVSHAWGKLFVKSMEPGTISGPICISITDAGNKRPEVDQTVHNALNEHLATQKENFSIEDSANTIFPYSYWERKQRANRDTLFSWYIDKYLPVHRKRRKNWKETYFERMINYRCATETDGKLCISRFNQLDHIINIWDHYDKTRTSPSKSSLQVTCFDPGIDHTMQKFHPFPCLQQVGFWIDRDNQLTLSAYYTTQYIIERAYGNYFGLLYLGKFLAHETGAIFKTMNCTVANPVLMPTKGKLSQLANIVRPVIEELE